MWITSGNITRSPSLSKHTIEGYLNHNPERIGTKLVNNLVHLLKAEFYQAISVLVAVATNTMIKLESAQHRVNPAGNLVGYITMKKSGMIPARRKQQQNAHSSMVN